MEGTGKDGPTSPEHKVTGTLHNRWILGGFFVEITHLWKDEGREARFLEIVGYDPYNKAYTSHEFRPNGTVATNTVSFNDRTYVISGTVIGDDGKPEKWTCTRVRCMKVVVLVGTLCLASGASAGAQVSEAEASKVRAEIEAAVQAVVTGANAVDVERTFASCSTSADFRMADNGVLYGSREATLAAFRKGFGPLRSQDIRILEHQVIVLSRDLAMYTLLGNFTMTDKSGQTSPARQWAWTVLWRREGTQWKMLNAHQSFAPALAP